MKLGISLHVHDSSEMGPYSIARSAHRLHRADPAEDRIGFRCLHGAAVGSNAMPPDAGNVQSSFIIDGSRDHGEQPQARVMLVDQRYFAALRIPLLQGRLWNADENNPRRLSSPSSIDAFAARYLLRPMPLAANCAFPISRP